MKKGVVSVLSVGAGVLAGAIGTNIKAEKKIFEKQKLADKHLALYLLMNQWVKVKQEGKNVTEYFEKNGYNKIAIYGMSYVGETLVDELKDSKIEIVCAIDKNADGIYSEIDMITPNDEIPQVDAVIVTPVFFFEEIEELLRRRTSADILSLEDILYEV